MAVYHHSTITRLRAEELLLSAGTDGSFLVRDSETVQGACTLCLLYNGVVKQYRIIPDPVTKELFVQAEQGVTNKTFPDISTLIQTYINRGEKNGLICALRNPVSPPDPDTADEDDEVVSETCTHFQSPDVAEVALAQRPHQHVLKYIKDRYEKLDLSSVDGAFLSGLQAYATEGVLTDADVIHGGTEKAQLLLQLLNTAAKDLNNHLNVFQSKVDLCRELFGPLSGQSLSRTQASIRRKEPSIEESRESLDKLFSKMSGCQKSIKDLEEKAVCTLNDLYGETGSDEPESRKPPTGPKMSEVQKIPDKKYMVKYGKSGSKMTLTVDISNGKLFAVKDKPGESLDENTMIVSDRIQQLIKSSKDNCRLDLKIKDRKSSERYVFSDARDCESFCQMVKQMKMMHNIYSEADHLSIFVGTWNMAENSSPSNLSPWLKCQGVGNTREPTFSQIPFDMYVIGTQEATQHEKEWVKKLKQQISTTFGIDMHEVESETLWQIRLVILVKPEYKDKISHVTKATVATGLANKLGNKGGVGISFTFNLTTFCFVTAHLAARHDEKRNVKRNQNYRDIVKQLNLGPKNLQNICDLTNRFHHVFFLGDLNYRVIDLTPEDIISEVKKKNYNFLLKHDQLKQAQKEEKAFICFKEETVTFPPTYKYQKGSKDNYSWEKMKKSGIRINAPSYCDRVLWKSYPDTHIECTSYGTFQDSIASDHKPVFASFTVGIQNQISSCTKPTTEPKQGELKICFENVYAEVKSNSREKMQLEFHSTCLEKIVRSERNTCWSNEKLLGYNKPRWESKEIPKLKPLLEDLDYLEGQYLIVAVKTDDGMESYGECVIAIKDDMFDCMLTHQGEKTGRLWGTMYITQNGKPIKASNKKQRQMSYDIVHTDTDSRVTIMPSDTTSDDSFLYSEALEKTGAVTTGHQLSPVQEAIYSEPLENTRDIKRKSDVLSMRAPAEVPKMAPRMLSTPNMVGIDNYSVTDINIDDSGKIYTDISSANQNNLKSLKSDKETMMSVPKAKQSVNLPPKVDKPQKPAVVMNGTDNVAANSLPPVPAPHNRTASQPSTPNIEAGDSNNNKPPSLPPRRGGVNVKTTPLHYVCDNSSSSTNQEAASVQFNAETTKKTDQNLPELPKMNRKQSRDPSTSSEEEMHIYSGAVFQRINTFEAKSRSNSLENDAVLSVRKKSLTSTSLGEVVATDTSPVVRPKVVSTPQYAKSTKVKKNKDWPKSMVLPPEENPVYGEKDGMDSLPAPNEPSESDERPLTGAPVLPPRKNRKPEEQQDNYDMLLLPDTLETWLIGLDLKYLVRVFKDNGWDRIDYLDDFNTDDLLNMDVTDTDIQQRILESIAEIKKA